MEEKRKMAAYISDVRHDAMRMRQIAAITDDYDANLKIREEQQKLWDKYEFLRQLNDKIQENKGKGRKK